MAAKQFFVPTNHATVRGLAEPGATASLYETGTTTPVAFYSDEALTVSLGTTITANGIGVFPIAYQDNTTAFRLVLKNRAGVELSGGDIDPYYFGDIASEEALAAQAAAEAAQAAAEAARDQILDALNDVGSDQSLSQVISGLGIIWTGNLNFTMSAGSFYIEGTSYTAAEQSITLDTADATNPRVDVLAVNTSGTLVKVTGTPAANPSQPDIDPSTQLFLKFVLVAAGATAPSISADEIVYEENDGVGEWTAAVLSGTSIAIGSTSEPDSGTTCIAATSAGSSAPGTIRLDKGSTISVDTLESLSIRFKSKTSDWATGQVRIHFQNANGQRVGSILSLRNGSFGLTTSNVSTYQTLTVPLTSFSIPAGTLLQYLHIQDSTGAAISWRMDNIKLKKSSTATGGTTGGITQTAGDARYLQRANNLADIVTPATARLNIGAKASAPSIQSVTSSATVTPTFSDDMVKVTAQAAALALANPTGTAVPGWGLAIRIKDNGTARAITYGTQYRAIGVTLPTTTVISKTLYLGCIWNSDDTKLDVVAVAQEA